MVNLDLLKVMARCSLVLTSVAHLTCVLLFIPSTEASNLGLPIVIAAAVGADVEDQWHRICWLI